MKRQKNTSQVYKFLGSLLIFVLFSTISATAETIELEHPRKNRTVELHVPDTYEDLREAYIEMSKLYLGERADHEATLEVNEELRETITDLETRVSDLLLMQDQLVDTTEELEDARITSFQQVVGINSYVAFNGSYGGGAHFGVMFRETIIGSLTVGVPLSFGIQLSYTW